MSTWKSFGEIEALQPAREFCDDISEEEFKALKQKAKNISGKINNLIIYLKNSGFKGPKYK